jgi:hypothetical protein
VLWASRAVWVAVGLAGSSALGGALADASTPVQAVALVGGWAAWAAVLLALLVPRSIGLTAVRAGAPAAVAALASGAWRGPAGLDDAVALALAVAAAGLALSAPVADALVDGSSYGDERRFALRTPPRLLPAAAVAWLLAVAVPAAGVLLLAARSWVLGAVLVVAGVAGARLGAPALHRLSRRWLVFVPAGVVVHDHLVLAEPVLLRRTAVQSLGPAEPGPAIDLTDGAGGLAVAILLNAPVELALVQARGRDRHAAPALTDRVLVAPLRPGAVVATARDRRVGR